MASDDENTIFIDVVPRVDESAADQAEHKLRDKFAHAGDSLKEKWWLVS